MSRARMPYGYRFPCEIDKNISFCLAILSLTLLSGILADVVLNLCLC